MSEIPALPKDGYWQEHGVAYATAAVARAEYGVHHPCKYIKQRLRKGKGKPHEAIGRFIRSVRRKFLVPPGRVVPVELFLVADLTDPGEPAAGNSRRRSRRHRQPDGRRGNGETRPQQKKRGADGRQGPVAHGQGAARPGGKARRPRRSQGVLRAAPQRFGV
jgi:hypothetical protein